MSILLEREISRLKKKILHLSAMVEENVEKAVDSVNTRKPELAHDVIRNDENIDKLEIELEEECLKILALHQPVAADLRYVISCLKINNDLERIGDLAVNIAERAIAISKKEKHDDIMPIDFTIMMEGAKLMLKKSLDAFIDMSPSLAKEVCAEDEKIDELNRQMHDSIIKMIKDKPKKARYLLHYLGVSRQLERISDYATNISEDVIYLIEGKIIRHHQNPAPESNQPE